MKSETSYYAFYYEIRGSLAPIGATKKYKRLSNLMDTIATDHLFMRTPREINVYRYTATDPEAAPQRTLLARYADTSLTAKPQELFISPDCTEKERLTLAPKSATMDKRKE